MKKAFTFLIILAGIGCAKADDLFTAQYPDKIKYNGIEYDLNSNPLEPYFDKHPDKRPGMISTALWRGYVGYFEIIDNELYLTDMKIPRFTDGKGNYNEKWFSIYRRYFPTQEKVRIDWFSGILILPYGKRIKYVHSGYASIYSNYFLLEIKEGDFKKDKNYSYKQFLNFKERQFAEFKKTKDYQTRFENLKNSYLDESDTKFIENFLKDNVMNYTSRFLVE